MESVNELVRKIISSRRLPDNGKQILGEFASLDNFSMEQQEGNLWDYKKDFPSNRSGDYFGGIVRLICAFYNTYGGLILFGIDDESREILGNPNGINIEQINALLAQRLTAPIECSTRRYDIPDGQSFDVFLVPKRAIGDPPVQFSVSIGKYPEGVIYVRQNHEVLAARSADMPFLYGPRRETPSDQDQGDPPDLIRALPASPSTVKEFIGRSAVMERLWHWLVHEEDTPRTTTVPTFVKGVGITD